MHAIVWKIRVILLQTFVWIVDLKVREHLTEYLKKDIKYHRVIIGVFVWKRCCHKRFCWSKYLLWFYSTMYLILCVDDIMSESEKNANLFAFDERRYYWVMKSRYNIKIFVENSALFYYEKSKVYFKETRKAGCIWTWENP